MAATITLLTKKLCGISYGSEILLPLGMFYHIVYMYSLCLSYYACVAHGYHGQRVKQTLYRSAYT